MTKKYKNENKYKIGIISYNINTTHNNFGAAIHSWAFQKYLNKLGISNVIVDYKNFKYKHWFKHPIKNIKRILQFPFSIYKHFLFRRFFKKNCNITNNTYYKFQIKNYNGVECFCCETDVTWVANKNGFNRAFMCDYDNMKNKDNIAYSVDIGSQLLNEENAENLKRYAQNFKYISFRNIYKLDYIKEIIDRPDICITIDPTLLLEEDDYKQITKETKLKKYVLVYNCKENNPEMIKQAKIFAKKLKLKVKIINCYDKNLGNSFGIPTPIGVENFLGYIKNATYIFTNSYHGICLAIIFKKELFAFSRNANNEKILTILEIANLKDRYVIDNKITIENPINYEIVYKNIEPLKIKSKEWLSQVSNFSQTGMVVERERERERE